MNEKKEKIGRPHIVVLVCGISYPWPFGGKTSLFSKYISQAIGFIREHRDEIAAVVVSGAIANTGKEFRERSEASRLAEFLGYTGVSIRHPVHIDEAGITTNDHLNAAAKVMAEYGLSGDSLVIFCEEARCGKMRILAKRKFGYVPSIITFPVYSGPVANTVHNLAAGLTILAEKYPPVNAVLREIKMFLAQAV